MRSQAQTLINTVNCVGVMGKGLALRFKQEYPHMYRDYVRRCEAGDVRLGQPYLYDGEPPKRIINFPTKGHWRSSSRLRDIRSGLTFLRQHLSDWGVSSLALPALGCGNGGLEWAEVKPVIVEMLGELTIDIDVYEPESHARGSEGQLALFSD